MGISIRHYILQENGALRRVSQRIVEGLTFGQDAIQDYANTRQRVVQVVVESEDRKPIRILDATGHYWEFDDEGKVDDSLQRTMAEYMDVAFAPPRKAGGTVVDLVPEIKKKDLNTRHRWSVTQSDLDRIAADLWPGINGPASDITSVKGKAPRKPSLTYEAKEALAEIGMKLMSVTFQLGSLTENNLRGLEFEALRTATFEDEALWRGVAEAAKHRRAILAAHRTGRGEWYAVIEAMRAEAPDMMRSVAEAHVKCASHAEAVAAGKQLMADKVSWLGPGIRIDVAIYSALEWTPEQN